VQMMNPKFAPKNAKKPKKRGRSATKKHKKGQVFPYNVDEENIDPNLLQ